MPVMSRPSAVAIRVLLVVLVALLATASPARRVATAPAPRRAAGERDPSFRLPLDDYPIDDSCWLPFGGVNVYLERCGNWTRHVADDACVPYGTDVFAVADGTVRYAARVGHCPEDWGWVIVTEHVHAGAPVCAVYGHCTPFPEVTPGATVSRGQRIAYVDWPCGYHHIHFSIFRDAFGVRDGFYPPWLHGYLPDGVSCPEFPNPFPHRFVDPVAFVLGTVNPVEAGTWGRIKATYEEDARRSEPGGLY